MLVCIHRKRDLTNVGPLHVHTEDLELVLDSLAIDHPDHEVVVEVLGDVDEAFRGDGADEEELRAAGWTGVLVVAPGLEARAAVGV